MKEFRVITGDNLPALRELSDCSVDAIVTDPPAGIGFMGKEWDKDKGGRDKWIEWMSGVAAECLRVIKPGGHALVWALPRTSHWTATAWENAGWEPRDRICHIFGSGFPKSTNISKQIDRMAGAEREVQGVAGKSGSKRNAMAGDFAGGEYFTTAPATDAARQWDGYGTALKPAVEDYWLFRKPIEKGLNIAQNVLKWGTGGLNIDGCRVSMTDADAAYITNRIGGFNKTQSIGGKGKYGGGQVMQRQEAYDSTKGRFPAHLIHDGSEEVMEVFPGAEEKSASRFFYCSKPGKRERDAGLEELEAKQKIFNGPSGHSAGLVPGSVEDKFTTAPAKNFHPTVKALRLMRYLCRLISPPGGLVLDPFTGSGSTGCAAVLEGFNFLGMEQSEEYAEIARRRIRYWSEYTETLPDDPQMLIPGVE